MPQSSEKLLQSRQHAEAYAPQLLLVDFVFLLWNLEVQFMAVSSSLICLPNRPVYTSGWFSRMQRRSSQYRETNCFVSTLRSSQSRTSVAKTVRFEAINLLASFFLRAVRHTRLELEMEAKLFQFVPPNTMAVELFPTRRYGSDLSPPRIT
jgi:hypothetical protein